MRINKTLSIALCAAMLAGTTAFAAELPVSMEDGHDIAITAQPEVQTDRLNAVMKAIEVGDDYIIGKIENLEVQLNVSEDTVILNAKTGAAASITDIKKGDSLDVCYSTVMTKSLPPQTSAYMIAIDSEGIGANLIHADEVETDSEGNVSVTDNSRNVIIAIPKDAQVTPYRTKNIVKLADITKGSEIVCMYNFETLSIPAHTSTSRVILVSAGDETEADNDNVPSSWAAETVKKASELGITKDFDGKWTEVINREQFCTLVYNLVNGIKELPVAKLEKAPFDDTDNTKVNALAFAKIVEGTGDRAFSPSDSLTREQAAVILCRAADYMETNIANTRSISDFADSADISDWAIDSVKRLAAGGIMNGTDIGFEPKANCTAEQLAATLVRIYDCAQTK